MSRALHGAAGVSPHTRAAVQKAAAELGYVPSPYAASLSSGRTGAIGVFAHSMTKWFFAAALDGAQQVLATGGYLMTLHPVWPDRESPGLTGLGKRMDGALALVPPELLADVGFDAAQVPLVFVGREQHGAGSVLVDDLLVGRRATEHLLELGHTRLAFVGGSEPGGPRQGAAEDRGDGFRAALADAGLPSKAAVLPSDITTRDGAVAFEQLWRRAGGQASGLPTGVVTASDELAIGLIHTARTHGVRVPQQLSVIGVDDHEMSALFGLTTVRQPIITMGSLAARMLLTRLAALTGEPLPAAVEPVPWGRQEVEFELVVRATTAAPRVR